MSHLFLAVVQTVQLNAWTELFKAIGAMAAGLGAVIAGVLGVVNFFSTRSVKKLAAQNVQISQDGQTAIGNKVDSVKKDLAVNTAKTEEVSKKTDTVVKQTNGDMEKAVDRVVSAKLDQKFDEYAKRRDKDLPVMIKTAVQEAINNSPGR